MFDEERKEEWFDYIAQEGVAIQLVRKAFVAKFFDAISRKERIGDIDSIGLHISEQEVSAACSHR